MKGNHASLEFMVPVPVSFPVAVGSSSGRHHQVPCMFGIVEYLKESAFPQGLVRGLYELGCMFASASEADNVTWGKIRQDQVEELWSQTGNVDHGGQWRTSTRSMRYTTCDMCRLDAGAHLIHLRYVLDMVCT